MRNSKEKAKETTSSFLMLAFCVIALVSIFTVKASIDKINSTKDTAVDNQVPTTNEQTLNENTEKAENDVDDISSESMDFDAEVEDVFSETTLDEEDSPEIPVVDSTDVAASYSLPMDMSYTTISKDYCMDNVCYNKTLDQYMTHSGVDFAAPEGSGVNAVCGGTITSVTQDDAYGMTIELLAPTGLRFRFCNLSSQNIKVETGDVVSNGQLLGYVGTSSLYESKDEPHLHLEVIDGEIPVDPNEYLDLQ